MNYGSTFFMLWPGSELFLSTSNHSNSVTVREKKTQTHFMSDVEIDGRNNNKSESSKFLFLFDYVWWSSKLIFCYTQTGNCQVVICSEWMCLMKRKRVFSGEFCGCKLRTVNTWVTIYAFVTSDELFNAWCGFINTVPKYKTICINKTVRRQFESTSQRFKMFTIPKIKRFIRNCHSNLFVHLIKIDIHIMNSSLDEFLIWESFIL